MSEEDDEKKGPPRITAVAWTTPKTPGARREFDEMCPWCKSKAEHGAPGISRGRRCPVCDAIAWGAPACDYDEVVDDALNHFRIDPLLAGDQRYSLGAAWWKKAGIDVLEGGCGAEHSPMGLVFWYWFRRVQSVN